MEVDSRSAAAGDLGEREARPVASSDRRAKDLRARSSGRSRSRGRNPSELLARRQQLAADPSWSPEPENNGDDFLSGDSFAPGQNVNGTYTASSVEARLESLSELLKNHTNYISSETTATTTKDGLNQHQHQHLQQVQTSPTSTKSIDDVYILLAKKEQDLQLAAELGKVLLEKNDELSKANERITEDYSHKLELLEQDKHKLKRKLDQLDGEYENRLIELQTDCNILKNQLDEQQQLARQTEKAHNTIHKTQEKSKLIDDLVQQNQRLTSELVEATKSEELLSSQLEQMSERFNVRMSNRQDHVAQLDTLKEEIQIVNQRKQDLERRLKLAQTDKQKLSAALDESGDKILLLENLLNEKEVKLNELLEEVCELRDSSSWLSNELESMLSLNERLAQYSTAATGAGANNAGDESALGTTGTTIGELEFASQRKRSQLIEQLKELRLKSRSRIKANEFRLINSGKIYNNGLQQQQRATLGQRRNGQMTSANAGAGAVRQRTTARQRRRKQFAAEHSSLYDELELGNRSSSLDEDCGDEDDDEDFDGGELEDEDEGFENNVQWPEELALEIYLQLRRFQATIQMRKDALALTTQSAARNNESQGAVAMPANNNSNQLTKGSSVQVQQHLYSPPNSTDDSGISATDDNMDKSETTQAKDPASWKRLLSSLKSLIEEMPCSTCQLMIAERADYEQLQKVHSKLVDEIRKKNDEVLALNSAKTEQEAKLVNLEERCAILSQDLSNCDRPKEEIVKLAWKARDEAVERKNAAEISLAKTRIENMQISSQLMEVVQQKGELSQKLAQFEDDIHYITQHSVKAKFTWEEYAEKLRRSKASQPVSANSGNSNPLAQLLGFSSIVVGPTSYRNNQNGNNNSSSTTTTAAATNVALTTSQQQQQDKSSAMDNLLASQPSSLMRNLTSNRFNLRFWQRSSSGEKQQQTTATVNNGELATDKGAILQVGNTS